MMIVKRSETQVEEKYESFETYLHWFDIMQFLQLSEMVKCKK